MRCTFPISAGFRADGSITFSAKEWHKEQDSFKVPCGKCLQCRLDQAREKAIRCVHEAKMHEKNSFITLTYDDEHLESPRLIYSHWQDFMKKLRHETLEKLSYLVTGEYGEKNKRPHWHAIIFGWCPSDGKPDSVSNRGDQTFTSATLDSLWQKGRSNFGEVTFESAGYCARYAAKKLVHGKDSEHDFHPISRMSSGRAIGRSWLEKYYWSDCFAHGEINLPGGRGKCSIPRYYERWLQKHHPHLWLRYVTEAKAKKIREGRDRSRTEFMDQLNSRCARSARGNYLPQLTPTEVKTKILESKFKLLQDNLKL